MKVYVQNVPVVWQTTASLAASTTSGSFICDGYARIVGGLITCTSAVAGSGLRISQSFDRGSNWDYHTDYAPSACSGSAYSIEIIGNTVKIEYRTDSAASQFRTLWQLKPI